MNNFHNPLKSNGKCCNPFWSVCYDAAVQHLQYESERKKTTKYGKNCKRKTILVSK